MLLSRKAHERRNALKLRFDVAKQFETIEESCIPSYAHPNPLAAWVSWLRLQRAAALYHKWAPAGDILDFGSATGEIFHLLEPKGEYWFVEENELLVDALSSWVPNPHRTGVDELGSGRFAAVFALDSLEHNEGIEPLITKLQASLADEGVMILSGPTENALYQLGRRLARFDGHYHFQTIWDIEAKVAAVMELLERRLVPIGIPLFSLSVWRVRWQ
jgi:2-polyprenyl-3-methyl-5-hydroxy-6-metoxy-1,4-benzoquinol methylase